MHILETRPAVGLSGIPQTNDHNLKLRLIISDSLNLEKSRYCLSFPGLTGEHVEIILIIYLMTENDTIQCYIFLKCQ